MAEKRDKGVNADDDTRDKGKREGKACSKMLKDSGVDSYCENDENEEPENENTVPENENTVPENDVVPENDEVPECEEVPECPTSRRQTEGMPGCSSVDTGTEWQQELAAEDGYFHYFNLKRFGAPPQVNSPFEALWNAENYTYNRLGRTNTAEDGTHLRWKALDLMRQDLDTYRPFMRDKQADDQVLRHQLHHLETIARPVEYDVFMALTQVMNAVILVTECSRSGNVRTNSYYFGVTRPDKLLHICWISSLGYYDAVVDFGRDSGIDICEKLEEKQMEGFPDLKPSHECDFRICSLARNWESPYILGTTATIEDRFMKDPVENDDGDSDGSSKDHVQLTSKEDHATPDSEA